jgi:3',5'-cyclic AMP phosphodiesterase CpdA
MRTLLQLSDLHFGATDPALPEAAIRFCRDAVPDVVAISGDLTQRARACEFAQVREFVASLGSPCVVVPGNHDVPFFPPWERLSRPLRRYRDGLGRHVRDQFEDEELLVLGVSTAHGWTLQAGRVSALEEQRAMEAWKRAGPRCKILITHHPISSRRLRPRMRAAWVEAPKLLKDGPELALAGHLHVRSAEEIDGVVHVRSGTTLSTRKRRNGNSLNVIRIGTGSIEVIPWVWDPQAGRFEPGKASHFARKQPLT